MEREVREYVEKISFLDSIENNFFITENFSLDIDIDTFPVPKVLFKILRKSLFKVPLKTELF